MDLAKVHEPEIRAALGAGEGTAELLKGWAASQSSLPETIFFLEQSYVRQAAQEAGLATPLRDALMQAARRIAADVRARALAWHAYHRLFHEQPLQRSSMKRWPIPSSLLGEQAGLLYPLALFGGLPELRSVYRAHGIPGRVAQDTLFDVQRWADHYRGHMGGGWGIAPQELSWLRLHLRGEIFGLGRLQFQPGLWTAQARAFRQRTSGSVVALSEHGVRYRADGQRDGAGGVYDVERAWTARLALESEWLTGHRITPTGRVEREETQLARSEWFPVLAPGDRVLHLHIPRGSPLDLEACRRSLEEAKQFFPAHFPELPFVAFACDSWLLDAQLEKLLPPSSNLVRFLRQMYLLPEAGQDTEALEWAFDGAVPDLAVAPRDTALRRALVDHLAGGGHLHGGSCFLLDEDLQAWGDDVYRTS